MRTTKEEVFEDLPSPGATQPNSVLMPGIALRLPSQKWDVGSMAKFPAVFFTVSLYKKKAITPQTTDLKL